MLNFDDKTIKKLRNQKTKVEDKLYLVVRFIEVKYQFVNQPNHWDNVFNSIEEIDRVFYKLWLWIGYVECESLIIPIDEFIEVFGDKKRTVLFEYLENRNSSLENLEMFYTLEGEAGEILLAWVLKKLKIN